jgi:hypothetical protein
VVCQLLAAAVALRCAFIARGWVRSHTAAAVAKFKAQWKGALFIPVCAAIVGWLTNWIAVQARPHLSRAPPLSSHSRRSL